MYSFQILGNVLFEKSKKALRCLRFCRLRSTFTRERKKRLVLSCGRFVSSKVCCGSLGKKHMPHVIGKSRLMFLREAVNFVEMKEEDFGFYGNGC